MPFYPTLGPQYINEKYRDVAERYEAFYNDAFTIGASLWSEAELDERFYAGDQNLWNDYYGGNLPAGRKRGFYFNHIKPQVNVITGYQRRNRKSTIAVPVENGDQMTADQYTKVMMALDKNDNVLETISEAFMHGACITGMSLLSVYLDFRNDPVSGDIKVEHIPYSAFLMDPYCAKWSTLEDCTGVVIRNYLTKREAINLMPEFDENIISMVDQHSTHDGKFINMAQNYNYAMRNLMTYDQFYYKDYRMQRLLLDKNTGETKEWTSRDDELLGEQLRRFPELKLIETEIPTVRLAILLQNRVMYDGPNPLGIDRYPLVPVIGYYTPQLPYYPWRVQGVVRGLRDAQYLFNRQKIIQLDILESQITSGWVYKPGSLVNPLDVFTLAGQGKGLALKDNAQMTDVQKIEPPAIPPTTIQITESLGQEIMKASGINEELMGSATDEKAGVLAMLRQGAGLTTLQILFDQLDLAQKQLGEIRLAVIQANYVPAKIKRILEGEEPSSQFYSKVFGKYHVQVTEGLNTDTQKQMQFAQMLQLKEYGVPITDQDLLEAATIQNKQKIINNAMQNKQQVQQSTQQQQQLQMAELQSRIGLAQARAKADEGLGIERLSRVQENQALAEERRAAAIKDEDTALLEKVKTLKLLEDIDIGHLQKYINLANQLKQTDMKQTPATQL
jgi:hypothetical protein